MRRSCVIIDDLITGLNINEILHPQLKHLWKQKNFRTDARQEDCRPQAIKLSHARVESQIKTSQHQSSEGIIIIQPRWNDEHGTILNTPHGLI